MTEKNHMRVGAQAVQVRAAAIEECAALMRRWRDEAAEFNDDRCRQQANLCQNASVAISNLAAQPPAAPVEQTCPGGIDPGFDECPKCGATMDDECRHAAALVETDTKSAPAPCLPQNNAEHLPSSDAAEAGADTRCSAATEGDDIEVRLKGMRQEIVDYIDSGADRGRVAGVPQGALEDWFDNLEAVSGLIRAVPQPMPVNTAMAQFVAWAMQEGPWSGDELDGDDVQHKARTLGLIVETKYEPEIHGESEFDIEPGDDWYVLAPEVTSALPRPELARGKS